MPDFFAGLAGIERVLLSIAFVFIAAAISRWQTSDLEKDLAIATVRSFIQLIAIGYVLELVFEMNVPIFTVAILLVMITIGGRTSGNRAKQTPNGALVAFLAIGIGSGLTIALLVALGVFDFVPKDIIPIGGMIVGTSMTTATLVITRLSSDFYDQRGLIESKLALGATGRQASLTQFQRTITGAMTPIIDTTKTVGLIKLPARHDRHDSGRGEPAGGGAAADYRDVYAGGRGYVHRADRGLADVSAVFLAGASAGAGVRDSACETASVP